MRIVIVDDHALDGEDGTCEQGEVRLTQDFDLAAERAFESIVDARPETVGLEMRS